MDPKPSYEIRAADVLAPVDPVTEAINYKVQLIGAMTAIGGSHILASEDCYDRFFSTEFCRLSDAAHICAGFIPGALERLRKCEFYEIYTRLESTLVKELVSLYTEYAPDGPPLEEHKLYLFSALQRSVETHVAKEQSDLLHAIQLDGLTAIGTDDNGSPLIKLTQLCTWVAGNFRTVQEPFKKRAQFVIKGTSRDEMHPRQKTFYDNREECLKAGVQVLAREVATFRQGIKGQPALTATELRAQIDELWPQLYPNGDGCPPLGIDACEDLFAPLISQAKKRVKKSG